MKKKVVLILLAVIVAVGVWVYTRRTEFLYAGTLEATEVDISAQVIGRVSQILVKEGDPVKKEDLLFDIAGEDYKLALSMAERDWARGLKLKTSGSIPEETLERLRFKRDEAALKVTWCSVRSPIDGVVLDRYHEPGELINPSMKILTLADLSEVWAMVYIPAPLLSEISVGDSVSGLLPDLNKTIEGRLVHIRDEAEFTPKNVQTREERTRLVYGVKVSFPNPDRLLKPGMSIEVRFKGKDAHHNSGQ